MRILHVHNRYAGGRGGEDVVVDAERELLRSAGHDVFEFDVANPSSFPGAAASLAAAPWNPISARRATQIAREIRPDVVHVHNTWFELSPSVLRSFKQTGARVVLHFHNFRTSCVDGRFYRDDRVCTECAGKVPWRGVVHRCYRDSLVASAASAATIVLSRVSRVFERYVDVAIALSEQMVGYLAQAGVPAERIRIKPNFVPDSGPRPAPPGDSDRVLFVGRLSGEKGVMDLIGAWNAARPTSKRLAIVGSGPLAPEVSRAAGESIDLHGWLEQDSVDELIHASRALIFPSRWFEAQPLSVLEAFSGSMPVLAADLGAASELIAPLGREWLFEPDDRQSFVTALRVLEDSDAVNRGGRVARATYERQFTAAAALASLESIYSGSASARTE